MIIQAPNQVDHNHLCKVLEEMERLGAPSIRVVHEDGDLYIAIEGSHRLAAAHQLGFEPELDVMGLDDEVTGHDIDDLPSTTTVAELLAYLSAAPGPRYCWE